MENGTTIILSEIKLYFGTAMKFYHDNKATISVLMIQFSMTERNI